MIGDRQAKSGRKETAARPFFAGLTLLWKTWDRALFAGLTLS